MYMQLIETSVMTLDVSDTFLIIMFCVNWGLRDNQNVTITSILRWTLVILSLNASQKKKYFMEYTNIKVLQD